jgi:hypothetical protein
VAQLEAHRSAACRLENAGAGALLWLFVFTLLLLNSLALV